MAVKPTTTAPSKSTTVQRLGALRCMVRDLAARVAFYRHGLGFRVVGDLGALPLRGVVVLALGGERIELVAVHGHAAASAGRSAGRAFSTSRWSQPTSNAPTTSCNRSRRCRSAVGVRSNCRGWIDAASLGFFLARGVPPWRELVETLGIIGTPILELNVRYRKAATYGERIEVHTCIEAWAARMFQHRHVARRGADVLCEATETRA